MDEEREVKEPKMVMARQAARQIVFRPNLIKRTVLTMMLLAMTINLTQQYWCGGSLIGENARPNSSHHDPKHVHTLQVNHTDSGGESNSRFLTNKYNLHI